MTQHFLHTLKSSEQTDKIMIFDSKKVQSAAVKISKQEGWHYSEECRSNVVFFFLGQDKTVLIKYGDLNRF